MNSLVEHFPGSRYRHCYPTFPKDAAVLLSDLPSGGDSQVTRLIRDTPTSTPAVYPCGAISHWIDFLLLELLKSLLATLHLQMVWLALSAAFILISMVRNQI